MLILSWNVRGMRNTRAFLALKDLLRVHKPGLIFLMETKSNKKQMEQTCKDLGGYNCEIVERAGMGGGLVLMWLMDWHVQVFTSSLGHIDGLVTPPNLPTFRFTGFYGNPEG